jgi:hypothetical protein
MGGLTWHARKKGGAAEALRPIPPLDYKLKKEHRALPLLVAGPCNANRRQNAP